MLTSAKVALVEETNASPDEGGALIEHSGGRPDDAIRRPEWPQLPAQPKAKPARFVGDKDPVPAAEQRRRCRARA
jgi:hypothetical protein